MANGRVVTGYSCPYVALYFAEDGEIGYDSAMPLARGVNVTVSANMESDNIFYADNQAAENAGSTFKDGTVTLTVDGLKDAARSLIYGLPEAVGGWIDYNDDIHTPYVGIGFIVRVLEDGETSYVPMIITKCSFDAEEISAETQGDSLSYQTQSLTANIFRGDDTKHTWKSIGKEYGTESEAKAALIAKLA